MKVWDGRGDEYLGSGTLGEDVPVRSLIVPAPGGEGIVMLTNKENVSEFPEIPEGIDEANVQRHEGKTPTITLDDGRVVYGSQVWWQVDIDAVTVEEGAKMIVALQKLVGIEETEEHAKEEWEKFSEQDKLATFSAHSALVPSEPKEGGSKSQ